MSVKVMDSINNLSEYVAGLRFCETPVFRLFDAFKQVMRRPTRNRWKLDLLRDREVIDEKARDIIDTRRVRISIFKLRLNDGEHIRWCTRFRVR